MTVRALLNVLVDAGIMDGRALLAADGTLDRPCTSVTYDSRHSSPGGIFVAVRGLAADGVAFAPLAIGAGVAAVVADRPPATPVDVPWVVVADARLALALLAAAFFDHPSRELSVIGVTGTNGKTTTAHLVNAIFEAAGMKCGLVGTVAYRLGDRVSSAARTTPEAPDLQAFLREMVAAGCQACAMEVSSHALALRRVDGVRFAAGVFTNLTRDHLDFHGGMDAYFAAKRRLFEMLPDDAPAVINADDPRGSSLASVARRPITYGVTKPADVSVSGAVDSTFAGLEFDVRGPRGVAHVRSSLVGRPNVYNILAAVAAATELDVPVRAVEQGIERLKGVAGRFEIVSDTRDDATVVVDYAHTDDALRNLLETARSLAARRLITVFGAGGGRDRSKRPLMGMVAARLSDVVVITSDNPRHEDPDSIIEDVKRGAEPEARQAGTVLLVRADRRDAIQEAIGQAEEGDVVLIAGKGHEKYQEIAGRTYAFDDVEVAREGLEARRQKLRVV
jgi:UDP-N-acetylmuramoyl-L-alanyl-D-glutamate--2,6-diaminopimelate ligase